jgi:hypothetical protein
MSKPQEPDLPPKGQFLVYKDDDGQIKIDVRLEGETAWLTQAQMAELFQTTVPNVNIHLRNVFTEGELQATATIKEFLIVRQEGTRKVSRAVEHYNLDAIISIGYRVKSAVATRFRIWATQKLREYIVKNYLNSNHAIATLNSPGGTGDRARSGGRRARQLPASGRSLNNAPHRPQLVFSPSSRSNPILSKFLFLTASLRLSVCLKNRKWTAARDFGCAMGSSVTLAALNRKLLQP